MHIEFRSATQDDLPDIIALLSDDILGATRERPELAPYQAAFAALQKEPHNDVIIGVDDTGRIVATYQLTFISGLSLGACRRAQIESVRIASDLRGQRLGERMLADAETRARAAHCRLIQLTMNASRTDTKRFYERLGFTPSHIGFKRYLD